MNSLQDNSICATPPSDEGLAGASGAGRRAAAKYNSKAVRVAGQLAHDLARGIGQQRGVLHSETQLARHYGISRITIRRALAMLVAEGLLRHLPNRGTVLADPAAALLPAAPPSEPEAAAPGDDPRRKPVAERALQIAALMAAPPDETLEGIKEGALAFARERGLGFRLIVCEPGQDQEEYWSKLAAPDGLGVDGLLVLPYPGVSRSATLRALSERGVPVVEVERRPGDDGIFCVEPDSAGGMYRATQYLLEKYRRPVHFLGLAPEHRADADRLMGYGLAMRDAGMEDRLAECSVLHEKGSGHIDWWLDTRKWLPGYELAQRIFERGGGPWSLACVKDYVAWGVYRAAAERGLSIGPEGDVAVTGFDGLMIAKMLTPGLTTMVQPLSEKGYQAAALLQRLMLDPALEPTTVTLPVELVIRGSA